ncbi:MAG: thiopeptide-type bacteriocin biosynthesis protein [Tannerellaceae bacterium]|nr:thiopeptide-type bacteriocin biosynthesis protein [Tannerellaceae bacterium]
MQKWFFLRYADPEPHLRIRFFFEDSNHLSELQQLLYKKLNPLIQENMIWKIQIDTYVRELERYGENKIEEAEALFHHDSECTLKALRIINKLPDENYRWLFSIKMIDTFLDDFSLETQRKIKIMEQLNSSFKKEFGFNEFNSKQFNIKYRSYKKSIEAILEDKMKDDIIWKKLNLLIHLKSSNSKYTILQIKEKLKKENLDIEYLISSYIHMMMNRIFRSRNRVHELIIYDFMDRYYKSKVARSKYNSTC